MGWYAEHVLPRLITGACGGNTADPLRKPVCAGLKGEVVEVGFGSGLNVPFYPPEVTRVRAVEPADLSWRLAGRRMSASHVPVERAGLDGQELPFDDDSIDTAVSTWTLCTIPDPDAALHELRRVLYPGGSLHFVEHGRALDQNVRGWQHGIEPVQKRLAGGCHLTLEPVQLIEAAGFTITELASFYEDGGPK